MSVTRARLPRASLLAGAVLAILLATMAAIPTPAAAHARVGAIRPAVVAPIAVATTAHPNRLHGAAHRRARHCRHHPDSHRHHHAHHHAHRGVWRAGLFVRLR